MKLNSSIALVAVVAALAAPVAAEAKAKPKAKAHHAAAEGLTTAEELRQAEQQLAQMQAQINTLQSKLDQTASAQAAGQAQAASDAKAAEVKADKALAAADAAKVAVAKTDKAVSAVKWAGDTKVSGTVFYNFSTISQGAGASGQNKSSGTGFNLKRVYVTIDHNFNSVFSARVTTDVSNVLGYTNLNVNSSTLPSSSSVVGKGLFLKHAYVQAKLDKALVIKLGSADMPWIPYVDGLSGNRYLDQGLEERDSLGNSADWGVHVSGDLGKYFSYQVSLVDGGGYRNAYVTKNMDVEGRLSANVDGFYAAVGGYTGKLGKGVEETGATPLTTYRTASRLNAAAGYKGDKFTVGAEYIFAKNFLGSVTSSTDSDKTRGYSFFANYNLDKKWQVLGRYDWLKFTPKATTAPTKNVYDHYFYVGLRWEPVKIVDITLLYKRDVVNNGVVKSSNGSIGCTTDTTASTAVSALCGNGTYDEVGIFGQLKF
ncbi:MAG TPA: hypothetical protein VFF98_08420 [Novosphingobium sp.]|nr:hypothetical protein [Novosphingobium sp.]